MEILVYLAVVGLTVYLTCWAAQLNNSKVKEQVDEESK
jgi:hypothetical protein